MKENSAKLIQELRISAKKMNTHRVFLGFDAFIDLVVKPIKTGNPENVESYYGNMEDFGQYLINKDSFNGSVELDLIKRKLGGNTPNLAFALGNLGVTYDCLAPFGSPLIDELFFPLQNFGNLVSIGDPGLSIAVEFLNGKLMLAINQDVNNLSWDRIKENISLAQIKEIVERSDMICLLNWSEVPKATDIFKRFKSEVMYCHSVEKPILIDLSDCSRKNHNEILEIIYVIADFARSSKIILGLNETESKIVCDVLGIDDKKSDAKKAEDLRKRLKIHWVVFHNRFRSILAAEEGTYIFHTRMTSKAVIQTGAGDHFNAGLCLGYLDGLDPELCLILASVASGYYVENGKSANIDQLINYIEKIEGI